MRVRRSLRSGSAWAAAAALLVAPLVVAPIVSAAEPSATQNPAETPAAEAAAAEAPAALAAAAPAAAPVADEQPAAAEDAPVEDPAAAEEQAQPAAEQQSAAVDAPEAEAEAEAPAAPEQPAAQEPTQQAPSASQAPAAGKPVAQAPAAQQPASSPAQPADGSEPQAAGAAPEAPAAEAQTDTVPASDSLTTLASGGKITARVVADRNGAGTNGVDGFAGATLTLQVITKGTWGETSGWTDLSTCVSVDTGNCTLAVPSVGFNKTVTQAKIVFTSTGSGDTRLMSVGTGTNGATQRNVAERVLDVSKLPGSSTVDISAVLPKLSKDDQEKAELKRSNHFTVVRSNPALNGKCGLKIGLLLDRSGSIGSATNGLKNLKAAANGFIDALTGTPSQVMVRNFATSASQQPSAQAELTSLATESSAAGLKDTVNKLVTEGGTNWDAGLYDMRNRGLDAVVFVTDGVPTYRQSGDTHTGPGDHSSYETVQYAVWSANAVKASNQTVMAVGVGKAFDNNGSKGNLQAVASADRTYQATDLVALKTTLRDLALQNCKGTVSIVKRVTESGTTTEAASVAGAGFSFTRDGGAALVTDADGAVNFNDIDKDGTATFAELEKEGYDIVAQGGKPAVCKNTATNAAVTVTKGKDDYTFSIPVAKTASISCTVYNKPKPKEASLTINHEWVDENGDPLAQSEVDEILSAPGDGAPSLRVGTAAEWSNAPAYGTKVTTTTAGGSTKLTVGTKVTIGVRTKPGKVKTGYSCEVHDFGSLPGVQTLTGDNTFTIKHQLSCKTNLTLTKVLATEAAKVAKAADWKLNVAGEGSGNGAYTIPVKPGTAYAISESGGPANTAADAKFEQKSVTCDQGAYNSSTGKATVARGKTVTCTFTNQLVRLDVKKTAFAGDPNNLGTATELLSGSPIVSGTYTWLFTIKNTGDAAMKIGSVTDSQLAGAKVTCSASKSTSTSLWAPFAAPLSVAPGATHYCKATGTVTR